MLFVERMVLQHEIKLRKVEDPPLISFPVITGQVVTLFLDLTCDFLCTVNRKLK